MAQILTGLQHCVVAPARFSASLGWGHITWTLYFSHAEVTPGVLPLLPQGLCTGGFLCLECVFFPFVRLGPLLLQPQFDHHSWGSLCGSTWQIPFPPWEPLLCCTCCTCNITFICILFWLMSASLSSPLSSLYLALCPTHSQYSEKCWRSESVC